MKRLLTLLAVLAVVAAMAGCHRGGDYRTDSGPTWGTFYNITYRTDRQLTDSIKAVMAEVDSSLSTFNPASRLSRINRGESDSIDCLMLEVLTEAQLVAAWSGGRFDPTVMPLVNLWGFGPAKTPAEPTQAQIDSALTTVGIARCTIDSAAMRLMRPSPATTFDFSAIAKGYGCDLVGRCLRRNGCSDYLVEIGGEIAAAGRNSRGELWRVQIDAPVESPSDLSHTRAAVIEVTDCGIASSGNYRNYRDTASGQRIGHTISPLTGRPVITELLAVTVIAPTCMRADALATACMAMPLAEARAMIESIGGVEALFITAAPEGSQSRYAITATEGFPERL